MSSHFANEKYYQLNRELTEKYFDNLYQVRFYQNASMALYDVVSGLQQFLAHKAHFAVAKNGSSLIESLSPLWTRNANPLQVKAETQNWLEFVETLHAETNFVIWTSENEITGEVLVDAEKAQEIHQHLSHKRIFSIQICHRIDPKEKMFPYALRILRPRIFQDQSSCLLVHGEKYKVNSQIGSYQSLTFKSESLMALFEVPQPQDMKLLQGFESRIANPKNVYFNRFVPTTLRLSDRLVLNYSQVNGAAIQQKLGLSDEDCFAPSRYPFWSLQLWKNWWKEAESEVLVRGLVVLSIHALRQDLGLIDKLNQCVDEFQRLGLSGNI